MRSMLWTVFEIGINLFESYLVAYFIDHVLDKRRFGYWSSVICSILFCLCCTSYLFFDMPSLDTWMFIVPLVYSLCCFANRLWEKLFWNIALIAIFFGVANLSYLVVTNLLHTSMEALQVAGFERLIFVIMSNLLLWIVIFAVTRLKQTHLIRPGSIIVFTLLNLLVVGLLDLLLLMRSLAQLDDIWLLSGSAVALGIFALSMCLYIMMSRLAEREYESRRRAEMLAMESRRIEELRSIYASLHGLRHDLKNHLQVASALIQTGRVQEGTDYIAKIDENVLAIFSTGCLALDSQLTLKELDMRRRGIRFVHALCKLEILPVSDFDLCSVVGNLLDNSIEAISRHALPPDDPCIRLNISRVRDMLYVECRNPVDLASIRQKDAGFLSSKREANHGWGIRNIERIVDRAQGSASFRIEDHQFVAFISIPYLTKEQKRK